MSAPSSRCALLLRPVLAAGTLLVAAGCVTDHYAARTLLRSDGRIERTVLQPENSLPLEVGARFGQTSQVGKALPGDEDWPDDLWSLRDGGGNLATPAVPGKPRTNESKRYLVARGTFDSAAAIPEHYVHRVEGVERTSRLERKVVRNDWGLVVEHRWEETLTDIVVLDEIPAIQRELLDLWVPLIEETLRDALGEHVDPAPLSAWLRGEGREWCSELVAAYVETGARGELDVPERPGETTPLARRFAAVCRRHGLDAAKTDEAQSDVEKSGTILDHVHVYAEKKLAELVRFKDGTPLDEVRRHAILAALGLRDKTKDAQGNEVESPVAESYKVVATRRHGSVEAVEKKTQHRLVRITGAYGPVSSPIRFDWQVELPGIVVETDGTLVASGRVHWNFPASAAYPFGRPMRARALEPILDTQRLLLGRTPVESRESLLAFAKIVAEDAVLQKTLVRCREQKSLAPLHDLRATSPDGDAATNARLEDLWKLLKLEI
jgi:hypothetical protein